MSRPARLLMLPMLAGAVVLHTSCTKDDIPSTPSPPFAFTDMVIGKTTTPTPGTAMTKTQNYTVRFQVAYTLNAASERFRNSLNLFADAYTYNTDSTFTSIGNLQQSALPAAGGAIAESLSFTVPTNAEFVYIEAYIDTIPFSNPVLLIDTQFWTVQ